MKPIVPAIAGFASDNSNILLTVAVIGTNIATAVVSGVATHKADVEIFDTEDEIGRLLSSKEKTKIYVKHHIPTAMLVAGNAAGAISNYKINTGRLGASQAAVQLLDTTLTNYKEAVVEQLGESGAEEVRTRVAEKAVEEHPMPVGQVAFVAQGETVCLDILSGRLFSTNLNKLKECQNNLNDAMLSDPYDSWVTLNDYYQELGMDPLPSGWDIGWDYNIDGQLRFNIASTIDSEGRPVLTVDPDSRPKPKRYK